MKIHMSSITGLLQVITHQRVKSTGAREIVDIVDPAGEPAPARIMPCAHHGHRRASDSTRGSIGLIVEQTAETGDGPGCPPLTQLINRFFERLELFIECTTDR